MNRECPRAAVLPNIGHRLILLTMKRGPRHLDSEWIGTPESLGIHVPAPRPTLHQPCHIWHGGHDIPIRRTWRTSRVPFRAQCSVARGVTSRRSSSRLKSEPTRDLSSCPADAPRRFRRKSRRRRFGRDSVADFAWPASTPSIFYGADSGGARHQPRPIRHSLFDGSAVQRRDRSMVAPIRTARPHSKRFRNILYIGRAGNAQLPKQYLASMSQ